MADQLGFDAAQDCSGILDKAQIVGVGWIGRYYSYNHAKNLQASEAAAILAAGFNIVSIWEARGNLYSSFTEANGLREAAAALDQAQSLGQPAGTCIYFAVDFDASRAQIAMAITLYFKAVNEVLAGHYLVGVYGSGLVCGSLADAGLAKFAWLAGATGWQGAQDFPRWNIRQGTEGDPWGFGFSIDTDNSAGENYGGWHEPEFPAKPLPPIEQILAAPNFYDAVADFQRANGLTPDRSIGPITLRKLLELEKA